MLIPISDNFALISYLQSRHYRDFRGNTRSVLYEFYYIIPFSKFFGEENSNRAKLKLLIILYSYSPVHAKNAEGLPPGEHFFHFWCLICVDLYTKILTASGPRDPHLIGSWLYGHIKPVSSLQVTVPVQLLRHSYVILCLFSEKATDCDVW
jgi:hypothetical protein